MSSISSPVLGTPLSPLATRVMLLGSGELGKEVIIALQRLGVEVIAVDRYVDAPGHQVAHRAHVVSMTDADALKKIIEQERRTLLSPKSRPLPPVCWWNWKPPAWRASPRPPAPPN